MKSGVTLNSAIPNPPVHRGPKIEHVTKENRHLVQQELRRRFFPRSLASARTTEKNKKKKKRKEKRNDKRKEKQSKKQWKKRKKNRTKHGKMTKWKTRKNEKMRKIKKRKNENKMQKTNATSLKISTPNPRRFPGFAVVVVTFVDEILHDSHVCSECVFGWKKINNQLCGTSFFWGKVVISMERETKHTCCRGTGAKHFRYG